MATEYKLSYTAAEINQRLGNVSQLSGDVGTLQTNVGALQTDIQNKAEVVTLSTSEYVELQTANATNANTLYMLNDAEEEIDTSVLYIEQELTDEQKAQARVNIGASNFDGTWDSLENRPFYEEEYFYSDETYSYSNPTSIEGNVVKFNINGELSFVHPLPYEISIYSTEFEITEIQRPNYNDYIYGSGYEIEITDGVLTVTLPVEVTNCNVTISTGSTDNYVTTIDQKYLPLMQSDWNDNDPASPYYVQNRTHYEIYGTGMECTLTDLTYSEYGQNEEGQTIYSASGTNNNFFFEREVTYVVNYPDFPVACVADYCSNYGLDDNFNSKLYVGNIGILTNSGYDSGEPFLIVMDAVGDYTVYVTDTNASEISLYAETNTVVQLDEKFIPDSIARVSDIPSFEGLATEEMVNLKQDKLVFDSDPIAGSSNPVTSSGVFNAIEGLADLMGVVSLGTLINDKTAATITHGEAVQKFLAGDGVQDVFLHVSDKVPTLSDCYNGFSIGFSAPVSDGLMISALTELLCIEGFPKACYDAVGDGDFYANLVQDLGDGLLIVGDMVVIIPTNNYIVDEEEGLIFPKKGVYFYNMPMNGGVTSFRINGFSFAESGDDEDGDDLYFGSAQVVDNVLTWDGNTTGLTQVVVGEMSVGTSSTVVSAYHISSVIPDAVERNVTSLVVAGDEQGGVTSVGVLLTENVVSTQDDDFGWFIALTDNATYDGLTLPYAGIYFIYVTQDDVKAYTSSLSIDGYTFPAKSSGSQPDWNQMDSNAKNFIKNKPVKPKAVTTPVENALVWDGNTTGLEQATVTFNERESLSFYKVATNSSWTADAYTITWIDENGEETIYPSSGGGTAIADNALWLTELLAIVANDSVEDSWLHIPSAGIYVLKHGEGRVASLAMEGYSFDAISGFIEILDETYIPDTIARTTDVDSKITDVDSKINEVEEKKNDKLVGSTTQYVGFDENGVATPEFLDGVYIYSESGTPWELKVSDSGELSVQQWESKIDALLDRSISGAINSLQLTSIRDYAFHDCSALTSIDLPNVTTVGYSAFSNCSALKNVNFSMHDIQTIASHTFKNCSSLTSIDLPNVTTVGDYVFTGCSALENINIPNVTKLGYSAFSNCSALTSIDLPNVTSIGQDVFQNCTNLISVLLRNNVVCSLATYVNPYAFANTPIASGTGYIYVPSALIEDYIGDPIWSNYATQLRALEDYTVDGTVTGELDSTKI